MAKFDSKTFNPQAFGKYIDILPPKSVGLLVRGLQDSITESENGAKRYAAKSIKLYQDIQFSIKRINDLERDEQEALSDLGKVQQINVAQYEKDLPIIKNRIYNLTNTKSQNLSEKRSQETARDTALANYQAEEAKFKKNEEVSLHYAYAVGIFQWLSETYDKKEKAVRTDLQEAVTSLFNNIYSGNRKVLIDENYNMSIYPMADAGGVKAIQYFSYVGGLVQLASKAMKERSSGFVQGAQFPLVLDAAFSHTDRTHTKSIAMELSKVTQQLIFAVLDKDWDYVAKDIDGKVYKTYRLSKYSEDESVITEE